MLHVLLTHLNPLQFALLTQLPLTQLVPFHTYPLEQVCTFESLPLQVHAEQLTVPVVVALVTIRLDTTRGDVPEYFSVQAWSASQSQLVS